MKIGCGDSVRGYAILTLLLATFASGCGGDDRDQPGGLVRTAPEREGLAHIHGLGVTNGDLYIATHHGLWRARSGEVRARRFSRSRQDIMGFSLISDRRFLGSGHPDPTDADEPPNLGLIESRDGGRTWMTISLRGAADFHVLQASGRHVYGVSSTAGKLMVSADGGRSWDRHTPPGGVFGLAIDPRDPRRIVASTEKGVFTSRDSGDRWRPLRDDTGGLLAWPRADALFLLGGDGGVQVSRDGGRQWTNTGNIGGQPSAFIASGDELYAALHDGSVKMSTDAGSSWSVRSTP